MELTNTKAIEMLRKARCYDVEESIENYPEAERFDRDDFQVMADEAGYVYSCYFEEGHCDNDARIEALELLHETKYGKVIPLDMRTLKPKRGYWPHDIQNAKDFLNMIARTGRLVKRLEKMGYISRWS